MKHNAHPGLLELLFLYAPHMDNFISKNVLWCKFFCELKGLIDVINHWWGKLRVPPMVERLPELRSPSFHFWQQLTPHIHLWYNVRELLCSTCSHDSQLPTRWAGRSKSGLRSSRWPDGRCVTTRSTLPTTPHSHRNQHLKKGELKEYSQIEMFKTESLHYS